MAKERTQIPADIAAKVQWQQDRTCCVCEGLGKAFQIHHVDDNPTNHSPSNLALLCFECHDLTQIKGGFARKLGPTEVTKYRDEWVKTVARRRATADQIYVEARVAHVPSRREVQRPNRAKPLSGIPKLGGYLGALPEILADACAEARPQWDSGITSRMVAGSLGVIDVLREMWIALAEAYPPGHFGDAGPAALFDEFRASRAAFHRLLIERDGPGTGGTIIPVLVGGSVLRDAKDMVSATVHALAGLSADASELDEWDRLWFAADR